MKENLENEELPFLLVSPAGQKFSSEQNYENNLGDLRFVPAVILMFAWDPVIAESVQNSSQKDTFLKSEVMLLLQST